MAGYKPLYIKAYEKALVQSREEFILPVDAFPILENAFVWRERIKRKQGKKLVGRLQREVPTYTVSVGDISYGPTSWQVRTLEPFITSDEPNASLVSGTLTITVDPGGPNETVYEEVDGFMVWISGPYTISATSRAYLKNGRITLVFTVIPPGPLAISASYSYYPSLPVMGICVRELNEINDEMTVCFDQKYAYRFLGGWQEFIPGTTWSGTNYNFFWSTNYWRVNNRKLFWVTNFSGTAGDPIRYTDGLTWTNFTPQIDGASPSPNRLTQCLCILPFRGRLVTFNTFEGTSLGTSLQYPNRIRWAQIGDPLAVDAWRDDIPGKGGFLDIPISQDIISVGFVRDNVVIYCERSTWQLRYTGRSIAPFQVEKINSELGAESTFSAVQFDTSLVGIGDKGIVQCDSFSSSLIDIKIPDLVFSFNNTNDGVKRIHGFRDFIQRIAYWTYPDPTQSKTSGSIYPNRRLIYNYENDSWAIFKDTLTTLGVFNPPSSITWQSVTSPWQIQNYPWNQKLAKNPFNIGGNNQGYVHYLDFQVTNDVSIQVTNLDLEGDASIGLIKFSSPDNNLATNDVVILSGFISATNSPDLTVLNGLVCSVQTINRDSFYLYTYNPDQDVFNIPVAIPNISSSDYIGGGELSVIDNFLIQSKKFNFADEGENIQLGYIDILLNNTATGEITMKVYTDYNDSLPVNILPENDDPQTGTPDTFFNSVIPTYNEADKPSSKNWKRLYCPTRAGFIFTELCFSNEQMSTATKYAQDVEIAAQVMWIRKAGKQLPMGI